MQTQTVAATRSNSKPAVTTNAKPAALPAATAQAVASVTLKALLGELALPPDGKLARRALRKAQLSWHTHSERWEFTHAQANEVRAVLSKLKAKPAARPAKAVAVGDTQAP